MYRISVDFSRAGWRQFARLNRALGIRFVKGVVLRWELAQYISAYEASGMDLDTAGQEIRYDDRVYLIMIKQRGIWYVTDVWTEEAPRASVPVLLWKRLKRGRREYVAHVLIGWRYPKIRMAVGEVKPV